MQTGDMMVPWLTWPVDLAVSDRPTPWSCHQFSNKVPQGPPSALCLQPRLPAPFPDSAPHTRSTD